MRARGHRGCGLSEFWAHALQNGVPGDVRSFLNPVPYVSCANGADGSTTCVAGRKALAANPLFASMEFRRATPCALSVRCPDSEPLR